MKIGIYPHFPLAKYYKEALLKKANQSLYFGNMGPSFNGRRGIHDLDNRLRMLDKHEGLVEVLTLTGPAVEKVADPEAAIYFFDYYKSYTG